MARLIGRKGRKRSQCDLCDPPANPQKSVAKVANAYRHATLRPAMRPHLVKWVSKAAEAAGVPFDIEPDSSAQIPFGEAAE